MPGFLPKKTSVVYGFALKIRVFMQKTSWRFFCARYIDLKRRLAEKNVTYERGPLE